MKLFTLSEMTFNDHSRSSATVILHYIAWTFYHRPENRLHLFSDKTAEMTLKVDQGQW